MGFIQQDLPVNIAQDAIPEDNGEITVTLDADSNPTITYTLSNSIVASIQVSDDDALIPELTISGPVTAIRENVGQVAFKVIANVNPQRSIELRYTPSETGGDFLNSETENTMTFSGFTFAPDDNELFSAEINVPIVDDEAPEPDGSIQVTLEPDSNVGVLQTYTLGSQSSFTVNIWDDDLPELTISAGEDVFEGSLVTANFIIYSSQMPKSNLRIQYTPTSQNFLAAGVTGQVQTSEALTFVESGIDNTYMSILSIDIAEDDLQEADERLAVELADDSLYPPKYALGQTFTAAVNVFDDDTPRFNIANSEIVEGDTGQSNMEFIVTLQPPVQQVQRIKWLTTTELGDSAVENQDFVAGNGELVFAAGTTEQTISIPIIGDTDLEQEESFSMLLFEPSSENVLLGNTHARGIISNDDFELTIDNAEIVEGNSGGSTRLPFSVTITPAPSRVVSLEWEVTSINSNSATANEDYRAETGQLEFAVNQTAESFNISIYGDDEAEVDETFTVELALQAGGGKIINAFATGTILNDDSGISISDGAVIEGNSGETEMEFVLTLAPVSTRAITVDWSTTLVVGDTATNDLDFESISETLRFSAGESTKTISVEIAGDQIPEIPETFSIELANPTAGIELLNSIATGTILNDDFGLRISDATILEGENGEVTEMVFEVVLDPPVVSEIVNVDWRTEPITDGFAAGDSDYLIANGTLIFNPNETQQLITIEIYDDNRAEQNEQFAISLFNPTTSPPSAVQIGFIDATGIGTIEDNDAAELSVESVSVDEVENETVEMIFTVNINPPYSQAIVVNWHASSEPDDLARAGFDFRAESGELLIEPGETSKSFSVQILDDDEVEPDETFTVSFSEQIDDIAFIESSVKGIIRDNDKFLGLRVISVAAGSESVAEGESAEFTITTYPDIPANESLMVELNVSQTGDYLMWRSPTTVLLDESVTTLSFETQDDEIEEDEGTITVNLVEKENNYLISQGGESATIAVVSDDIGEAVTNEPKISVASSAVNSILAQLQQETAIAPRLTETNRNLPIISISAVNATIDEGDKAEFIVKSVGGESSDVINIELQVSEVGQSINWPVATSVQISGNSLVSFLVESFNDDIAEEDGEIIVKVPTSEEYLVSESASSAVVSISDEVDRINRTRNFVDRTQIVSSELMRAAGETSLETIAHRIRQGLSNNQGYSLEVGGKSSLPELLKKGGEYVNEYSSDLLSFFDDSSFSMTLLSNDLSTIPTTLWGRGDLSHFNLNSTKLNEIWSGDLFTAQLGLDSLIGDELLAGFSTSASEGDLEIENSGNDETSIFASTATISPYFGWSSENHLSEFQVMANFVSGSFKYEQENYEPELVNSNIYLVAANGRKQLFSSKNFLGGESSLSLNGESWVMRQTLGSENGLFGQAPTWFHQMQLDSEFSQKFKFSDGAILNPKMSIGLHLDEQDNQSLFDLKFRSVTEFSLPIGLSLSGTGQLSLNEKNKIQNQTISSQFKYDKFNDDLGLNLMAQSNWGTSHMDNTAILTNNNHFENIIDSQDSSSQIHFTSEIGYGISLLDNRGILKPFSRFELSNEGQKKFQIGSQFSVSSNTSLDFEATLINQAIGPYKGEFKLNGAINW